ncbi:aspartyl protease family protein [Sphingomonas sp. MA1305]|uniref:aspartyl protease family protein n=1 Tax=Sphingomonas sp. MA1305 TaxID=2479204 RepID=UPI001E2F0084|nr:aspartyl protease family protein [Sphingomonas sp. MA1305]
MAIAVLAVATAAPAAAETCKVGKVAELAVTMQGLRPIVQTTINGKPAPFIVDSGAFFSTISPPVAKALDLPAVNMPGGLRLRGIGGTSDASVARVRHFGLAGFDLNDVQFVVGGTDIGQTGLLGQNVLGLADVEYDLPDGAVRLFKTTGCGKTALAYWSAGKPFFALPIESKEAARNHTVGAVELDGAKLRATFDTGAAQTVVTLRAAAKAGVHPGDPGVETAGWQTGLGKRVVQGWIGKFAVIKIGDEELHNVRLRIADLGDLDTDMLIGADYFISHRIFVSNAQRRMYFTYTGGRLFDMGAHIDPAGSVVASGAPEAAPTDADGWARRAAMFQTQRDLPHAIDAYTQAITLAPKDPRFPRQRALVYLAQRRPVLALDDLNTTLTLDPNDLEAQLIRAQVRLRAGNLGGSISDLDAISARLPREDARRMALGQLYSAADAFDAAIGQYDSWLATHRDDAHRSQAQNGRCWARVLANRDLDKARSDCDAAVRAVPSNASFLDSRGLVALRQGDDAAASRDFAAALAINPKLGWSLYGRSVVERRQGQIAQADADLAAARAVDRTLPDRAKRYGL